MGFLCHLCLAERRCGGACSSSATPQSRRLRRRAAERLRRSALCSSAATRESAPAALFNRACTLRLRSIASGDAYSTSPTAPLRLRRPTRAPVPRQSCALALATYLRHRVLALRRRSPPATRPLRRPRRSTVARRRAQHSTSGSSALHSASAALSVRAPMLRRRLLASGDACSQRLSCRAIVRLRRPALCSAPLASPECRHCRPRAWSRAGSLSLYLPI